MIFSIRSRSSRQLGTPSLRTSIDGLSLLTATPGIIGDDIDQMIHRLRTRAAQGERIASREISSTFAVSTSGVTSIAARPVPATTPVSARFAGDAERTAELFLTAAAEVFADRGLDVSLDDIAKHAGSASAPSSRRFPTKDQLVEALF